VKRLFPACKRELAAAAGEAADLVGGQAAQDVDELLGLHRGAEDLGGAVEAGAGAHLDLQVGGDEFDLLPVTAQQHIGQDGQGVALLDDAGHRLQGSEQLVLRAFEHDHRVRLRAGGFWGRARFSPLGPGQRFRVNL
jgi:hypothetical protein